ncbi:MAG: N-6 DNA methylase [Candidatus Brocadiales bacterium]|nr:N-6 DNA methylase [Candidatus Brocadiales bacterium]
MKTESALSIVYNQLDFNGGQLFDLLNQPSAKIGQDDWLNKGEWLIAAKKAGAEKIFFVDNNPVVIFAKCNNTKKEQINCFNRLWSLARPRILFLECEGDLSVIDLAQKPIPVNAAERELKTVETLCKIKDVTEKLQAYHRDNIESGKVFEQGRFGDLKHRADQSLIANLKTVRKELIGAGLNNNKIKYAHALIGRSIFIRYLEDRKILTEGYFKKIARPKAGWTNLLKHPSSREGFDFSEIHALYPKVLQNKEFTYALFKSLSKDFNGDMFPDVEKEEQHVQLKHLRIIQDLLYGDVGIQKKLFFFSYKFEIIPLDLISAIYEEFYHSSSYEADKKSKARQDGAFYTPSVLAEFVLSRVLTIEKLKKKPKVLDPACGSGIFLVEAFRRMVRYAWKKKKAPLDFNELKEILGNQISGIETNEEAARITTFSLYLAMLHYLDPPSILEQIRKGNKLPNLLVSEIKSRNHFNSIQVGNAFSTRRETLGRIDVIVGNPPWGAPGNNADIATKERQKVMLDWCTSKSYPIGDKEPSQAFLWRALEFLKDGGCCALLTSAGVLFKHGSTTQAFRNKWMSKVCLNEVFNFTHVRKFFFKGAISPFVMIHFTKEKQGKTPVKYWSAKQVIAIKETQAVLLSKYDHNYLVEQNLTDNKTWKINWFGRHADVAFLNQLGCLEKLINIVDRSESGQGYMTSSKKHSFSDYSLIPSIIKLNSRYDIPEYTKPPERVHRKGKILSYSKDKILLNEGLTEKGALKGILLCNYFPEPLSFSESCYSLVLRNQNHITYSLLLGVLWSSLTRYYFFNTTANWGLWNDKILLDELLQLPIPKNYDKKKAKQVVSIVNKLRNYHPQENDLFNLDGIPKEEIDADRRKLEIKLDKAVYGLYSFTEEQRDLIRDCCEVTLPFFYQPYKSVGVMPAIENGDTSWVQKYADIFARRWKPYLNDDEVMRADVHIGASGNMLAFEFYPADTVDNWNLTPQEKSWDHILEEIGKALPKSIGTSQIVLDGVVHAISDDAIIIIKRNEKRFWTRSLAREDATSTLCKRMLETMPQDGGVE